MKKIYFGIIFILSLFTFNSLVFASEKTDLTIKNVQNTTDKIDYSYNIHIDDVKGAMAIKKGSDEEFLVFDYNGNAIITVTSNTDLVIKDVPKGANYNIEVEKISNYQIKINNLELTSYNGTIGTNSSITISSYKEGSEESEIIISKGKKEDPKKDNPSTSDHIAILGLIALFSLLFIYTITHKFVKRFEDNA